VCVLCVCGGCVCGVCVCVVCVCVCVVCGVCVFVCNLRYSVFSMYCACAVLSSVVCTAL